MFSSVGGDCLHFILYAAILHPEPDPDTFLSITLVCKSWLAWCRNQQTQLHDGRMLGEVLFPVQHHIFGCNKHPLLVAWCSAERWKPPTKETKYTRAFLARMVDFKWVPFELKNLLLGRDRRRMIQFNIPGLPNVPTETHIITHQCKMGIYDHLGPAQPQVVWVIRWGKSGYVISIETDRPVVDSTSGMIEGVPQLSGDPISLFGRL